MVERPTKQRGAMVSLWLRIYFLCFVGYQVAALPICLWLGARYVINGGSLPMVVGVYVLLVVPAGFGITLLISLPITIVWYAAARVMGWPLTPPPPLRTCGRCGYDLRGLAADTCPECGSLAESRPPGA